MSLRSLHVLGAVGLLLSGAACSSSPPSPSTTWSLQREQQRIAGRLEIRRVLRDLEIAESSGNLPALASLYSPDAVWVPPEGPPIRGREAILAAYELLFAEQDLQVVLTDESVAVTPASGQALGWVGVTQTPVAGGEPTREIFRYRMVLERVADPDRERPWRIRSLHWWPWVDLYDGPEPFPGPALPDPALDS